MVLPPVTGWVGVGRTARRRARNRVGVCGSGAPGVLKCFFHSRVDCCRREGVGGEIPSTTIPSKFTRDLAPCPKFAMDQPCARERAQYAVPVCRSSAFPRPVFASVRVSSCRAVGYGCVGSRGWGGMVGGVRGEPWATVGGVWVRGHCGGRTTPYHPDNRNPGGATRGPDKRHTNLRR